MEYVVVDVSLQQAVCELSRQRSVGQGFDEEQLKGLEVLLVPHQENLRPAMPTKCYHGTPRQSKHMPA